MFRTHSLSLDAHVLQSHAQTLSAVHH